MRLKNCLVICSILLPLCISAASKNKNPGNFSLAGSQQPGSLMGLAQNILGRHELQFNFFADSFDSRSNHLTDLNPYVVYGLKDDLSLMFSVPIAASYKSDAYVTSRLEDMLIQLEYSYYQNTTTNYSDQATVFANVTFPTGSAKALPSTGFGSPSILLGATVGRIYEEWFAFSACAVSLKTSQANTRFGNQYYYQFGFGKNIFTIDSELIVALVLDVDGLYSEKNKIAGVMDDNSGGNTVFMTPSLWISTPKLIAQFGVGAPVEQHLFGEQQEFHYVIAGYLGWVL